MRSSCCTTAREASLWSPNPRDRLQDKLPQPSWVAAAFSEGQRCRLLLLTLLGTCSLGLTLLLWGAEDSVHSRVQDEIAQIAVASQRSKQS